MTKIFKNFLGKRWRNSTFEDPNATKEITFVASTAPYVNAKLYIKNNGQTDIYNLDFSCLAPNLTYRKWTVIAHYEHSTRN